MSATLLALLAIAAPAGAPVTAPTHAPDVEERLSRLVGNWGIQGLGTAQFNQKCSWFGPKAFVLCSFTDKRSGLTGQAAFGYSAVEKRFTYSLLESTGRSLRQLGFPNGHYGFVFVDERMEPEGPARTQTNMLVEDDGIHWIEYRSIAGGNWQKASDYVLVPTGLRPAARRRR